MVCDSFNGFFFLNSFSFFFFLSFFFFSWGSYGVLFWSFFFFFLSFLFFWSFFFVFCFVLFSSPSLVSVYSHDNITPCVWCRIPPFFDSLFEFFSCSPMFGEKKSRIKTSWNKKKNAFLCARNKASCCLCCCHWTTLYVGLFIRRYRIGLPISSMEWSRRYK